jgi:hypothetical protein
MKTIVAGMLVLLGFAALAQKPAIVTGDEKGWYQIGKVSASFKSERESIVVMGKDEFETIKLRVEYAPINIERMQVYFEGGKVQDINVKQPLKAGEETKEFELEAENKEIDKVVFYYHTVGNAEGERAAVELYGFKDHRDRESAGLREENDEARDEVNEAANDVEDAADKSGEEVEEDAERTGDELENASSNVRDEVDEHATKMGAEISDRELENRAGPDGQEIYIDDSDQYYYVNEQGEKVFVAPEDLTERVR